MMRGLVLVDDVAVTDRSGLPLTRDVDGRETALAAVGGAAAACMRRLAGSALPVVQVAIETFTADHVCVRALAGRGDGALLVVKTTSQPVSPLAVDDVVHASARRTDDVPSLAPLLAVRGTTETKSVDAPAFADLFREMTQELRGDVSGLVLTSDGKAMFCSVKDGPAANVRTLVASELGALQARVGVLLRGEHVARVEAVLRDGSRLSWATLAPKSRLALVTFGRADARLVARLGGRLRRAMNDRERFSEHENAA